MIIQKKEEKTVLSSIKYFLQKINLTDNIEKLQK